MFVNEWSEDVVHHGLECGWGICGSEEHYGWFKHAIWGFERSLPLVALLDTDVVVSPPDVEFSEDERMDQVGDSLFNIW